jgi:hypothetical protein
MLDLYLMHEFHRFDTLERERYHSLRANWDQPGPDTRPDACRSRIAALLLSVANWLDPRGAPLARPARMTAASFVGMPLHRVGRG